MKMTGMTGSGKVWKWLGVAGVAGVAAGGAVVARDHRRRQSLTPEQVRKQLHRRLADLDRTGATPPAEPADPGLSRVPIKRRRRRG